MTDKNRVYFFIAAALSLLIPVPGRLSFAIVILLLFNVQMAAVTLCFHGINALGLKSVRNVLLVLSLIFLTVLYKQFLIAFCPIIALTLGFCLYLPALSTVAIDFFFEKREEKLFVHLMDSMQKSIQITAAALLYFLIREVVGYGTVSFPGMGKIIVFHLPFAVFGRGGVFFATMPGNFALIAVALSAFVFVRKKFAIVRNAKSARKNSENEK